MPPLNDPADTAVVPCNGCTACCQGDGIFLHPEHGDDPAQYETEAVLNPITGQVAPKLKQQPNGDCIYLDRGKGCTIHDRRPAICRAFDCRDFWRRWRELPKSARRRLIRKGAISKDVLQAGIDRLGAK